MTLDGHDGYIWYQEETSFGVIPDDGTWIRLLEVENVSGRGSMQEVKDIRRHGLRRRAGTPSGKREEDDLVFDVILTDDDQATNIYDVFLKTFDSSWDDPTILKSYVFLICDDPTPIDTDQFEYYYGCTLNEAEIVVSEGEPIKATLTFVRKTSLLVTTETHTKASFTIDTTGNTVTFADANPDTITRANGSWLTDGLANGDQFSIAGSTLNNGTYTIAGLTATVITLIGGDTLVAETATTVTITFDALNVYSIYPTTITYLTWTDVAVVKVGASGWTNTGAIANITEITVNVNQGAEKKFRLNQSDECVGVHMGGFEVTGSITFDYDNQNEIDEIENQTWGNITITITPTAGQMGEITLTDVSYDGYPFDSAVNSLITADVDFAADDIAFGD